MFAVLFIAAAGVLAVWFVVRWPRLAPNDFRLALVHVGASMLAFYVAVPLLQHLIRNLPEPYQAHVSIFGLLLPAFVYRLVSMIWMLRLAQGSLGSAIR